MLAQMPELLQRLRRMLLALPALRPAAPEGVIAVEVRNPEFLTPAFADVLREAGAAYCLGLHPKMPPIGEQLPVLRALWPGPLVCRWNLNRLHGAYGYEEAKQLYEPFDKLVDPDPETRETLAGVIAATTAAGHAAYVTINNKAEGCTVVGAGAGRSRASTRSRRVNSPCGATKNQKLKFPSCYSKSAVDAPAQDVSELLRTVTSTRPYGSSNIRSFLHPARSLRIRLGGEWRCAPARKN